MAHYTMEPVDVPHVQTRYRRIQTMLPVPDSLAIFRSLEQTEPRSMRGQPPVVWHRAEDFQIWDRWGNMWIDWSSGVLVANAGHGRKEIGRAIQKLLDRPLISTYVFVHEKRAELAQMLKDISPEPEGYRVFLLTTGSEAVENSIKLAKTYAMEKYGKKRKYLVSFINAFHGRTLGSQLAGGLEKLKQWIAEEGNTFIQVPFPDGFKNKDVSFDLFLKTLESLGVKPTEIAGVLTESFQGVGPDFMPYEYAQNLQSFCKDHDIVMIFDEIQGGFGRTGKMFAYEHYGIKPDLITCGKGMSSSLPISAVIGRNEVLDLYGPGSMTSTHSASPLPVTAACENLKIIQRENLVEQAERKGEILLPGLRRLQKKYPDVLGCVQGRGLVAGIQVVRPGMWKPAPDTALKINERCFQKGLLMFAPVGVAGETIKIAPPLTIPKDALIESIQVMEEACDEVLNEGV